MNYMGLLQGLNEFMLTKCVEQARHRVSVIPVFVKGIHTLICSFTLLAHPSDIVENLLFASTRLGPVSQHLMPGQGGGKRMQVS